MLKTIRFNYENVCLKKNLKMLRHITFLVSRSIWTYELIASSLIEGGISWSCHPRCSHKGAILLLRHMCTQGLEETSNKKGECDTAND